MSLMDCPGCWNIHCTCPNGGEWRRLDRKRLLEIRAAIDAALVLGPETAEPAVVPEGAPPTDCGSSNHAPDACGNCEACREVWGLGGPPSVNDLLDWVGAQITEG